MAGLIGWRMGPTKASGSKSLKSVIMLPSRILDGWAQRNHTCPPWKEEGDVTKENTTLLAVKREEKATSQGTKMLLEAEGKETDSLQGPQETECRPEPSSLTILNFRLTSML